jgi:hypothetical protein
MTARVKIFIASSSEGLEVADAVRSLLVRELRDKADVDRWTWKFALSATYIESLEKASHEADFAVLVLTPDDLTTSREVEKLAPRDNVIFELGLFIGSLGRGRCFLVHEQRPDLKLPTDLLGVNPATFKRTADDDLKSALDAEVLQMKERINELGGRHKLTAQALASRAAIRGFSDRVTGGWWERVAAAGGKSSLSFFQIEHDEVFDSVQLRGRYYHGEGSLIARWNSIVVRIQTNERKILYHWQGSYPATPNDRFHGFAEKEFEGSAKPGAPLMRGHGKFWDVDEARPEKTSVRSVDLRRIVDANVIATITDGKEKDVRSLIIKTLDEW